MTITNCRHVPYMEKHTSAYVIYLVFHIKVTIENNPKALAGLCGGNKFLTYGNF